MADELAVVLSEVYKPTLGDSSDILNFGSLSSAVDTTRWTRLLNNDENMTGNSHLALSDNAVNDFFPLLNGKPNATFIRRRLRLSVKGLIPA